MAAPAGALTTARFEAALPAMLADLEQLVRCESPSADLAAVAASAEVVAGQGAAALGAAGERLVVDGRTHLRWRLGEGPRRVLVLGHHDTVWPIGTLATLPWSVRDGIATGPGCFDMKAGLVQAFHALAALRADGHDLDGVTVLVTGDEEVGSPSSEALIRQEARGCDAAFVLEASADGGALKTGRKGASMYEIAVSGRAAHAGLEPEKGVNAGIELAHQVLAVAALADPARATTVTPSVLQAGTTTNTVPASARLAVDVRVLSVAEQERVDRAVRALPTTVPGARVSVSGGPNRPPLSPESSATLFALARDVAARLGLDPLDGVTVGGASDANFTAGAGVPTLDGLGAVGGGAHADDEHVRVAELPRRTALLAGLVTAVLAGGGRG
ncbi:glutamate carboxypeptidase [Pseudonocardia kunmingensis]|uniref:Glutamate carboxypeptidase n=2 Tax=Pseudonocardia kunmingensis TaxID=630975 RepID=A0A543DRU4_9PSEU|nr:glutamate carboxypeptidase [Pseudonocardia kunmingensis]